MPHQEQPSRAERKRPGEQRQMSDRGLPGFDAERLKSLGLSRRELVVLERVAEGWTNGEIARALGLSPLTVKKHLERMCAKLGATNRAALVATTWQRSRNDPVARIRRDVKGDRPGAR